MNPGERPHKHPMTPPPQLESVHMRSTCDPGWCAAGADRSHSWPSTKPDRRLGPGFTPGRPQTEPGMQLLCRAGHLGSRPRIQDPSRGH